jgi:hypothetical protein
MIKYLIAEVVREYLENNLNTGLSEKEPYWVNKIESFRYLSNPASDGTRVVVYADNPDEIEYRDARIDANQTQMFGLGYNLPVGEVGGGHYWWRRGSVRIDYYGIGKIAQPDRYDAAEVGYAILGRVHNCLDRIQVSGLIDPYGEQAIRFSVITSSFKESGGNKVNIWRGMLCWQVLTQREI